MRNRTCPDCASTVVYKTDFSPLQTGDSLVRLYNPKGNNLAIEVYLCARCGHMEMGVLESHRAKIADLIKTDKWTKVG